MPESDVRAEVRIQDGGCPVRQSDSVIGVCVRLVLIRLLYVFILILIRI